MTKKQLLDEITKWAYNYAICVKQDANFYFNYGYLTALKRVADEMGVDYAQAEEEGTRKGEEYVKAEKAKNKFQLSFA